MFVSPGVKTSGNDLLGMVLEIMENRNIWVPGDLCSLRSDFLVRPQIIRWKLIIRAIVVRTQQHAAHGMERDCAGNIRVSRNKVHQVACLWLRSRIWPCAMLITFRPPACREVSVQVQALLGT